MARSARPASGRISPHPPRIRHAVEPFVAHHVAPHFHAAKYTIPLLALLLFARLTSAATYTIQPDATAGVDGEISNATGFAAFNFGVTDPIVARFNTNAALSPYRALLRFDMSALPGSATMTACKLTVNVTSAVSGAAEVDRITTTTWVEGTGNGSATVDGATWLTWDGTNLWTSAGGDFTTTGQTTFTSPSSTGSFDITGMLTLCQDAMDSRSGILNVLIKFTTELTTNKFFAFSSSDNGTAGNRPKLTVDYSDPVAPRRRFSAP